MSKDINKESENLAFDLEETNIKLKKQLKFRFMGKGKELLANLKKNKFKIIITTLLGLGVAQNAYAISEQTHQLMKEFYDKHKSQNEIVMDEGSAKEALSILNKLSEDLKEDIKKRNFNNARRKLELYVKVFKSTGQIDAAFMVDKMIRILDSSFIKLVDLSKPGVYSDQHDKIFVIGKTKAPYNPVETRMEALEIIKEHCKKQGIHSVLHQINLGKNRTMISKYDEKTGMVDYLILIDGLESGNMDLGKILAPNLSTVPGT